MAREVRTRSARKRLVVGLGVAVLTLGATVAPAAAAKKIKACTIVPQTKLEAAVGNAFETPEDSTIGPVEASCRFGSADVAGTDLNLFLSTDVKGGVKDAIGGNFFATK